MFYLQIELTWLHWFATKFTLIILTGNSYSFIFAVWDCEICIYFMDYMHAFYFMDYILYMYLYMLYLLLLP